MVMMMMMVVVEAAHVPASCESEAERAFVLVLSKCWRSAIKYHKHWHALVPEGMTGVHLLHLSI